MKGAMIRGVPPEDRPYSKALCDPFWAAAQDLEVPFSLHIITQKEQREIKFKFDGPREGGPPRILKKMAPPRIRFPSWIRFLKSSTRCAA